MDREELRGSLCNLLKRVTGETPAELKDSDSLVESISLDSISLISLVLEMEEEFAISFSDAEVQGSATVGNLLDLILMKLGASAPAPQPAVPSVAAASLPPNEVAPAPLRASVRGIGIVDLPIAEIGAMRERVAAEGADPKAQSVARLCDDQTILGILAVKEAMRHGPIRPDEMTMWNLIASSRFLGRLSSVSSWRRFEKLGPSRMSPLLIPFVSLHAGASVLSLYFDIHGPSFGVGGCADHVSEGLLSALTVPMGADAPGSWMVFTGWEPEPVPDEKGNTETPSRGYGVALALAEWDEQSAVHLTYKPQTGGGVAAEFPTMRQFVEGVAGLGSGPCELPLSAGGAIVIEKIARAARKAA
jgi:acyl carrier protein